MGKRILIIQGHPDPGGSRYGHALATSYADGARDGGHEVKLLDVAKIDVPMLRTQQQWESGELSESLQDAQNAIGWAEHIVVFFPLWLGSMPALLKAFFEQVMRPGFAIDPADAWRKKLTGRSARVVVTMGMPALVYRWFYFAHGVRSFERSMLAVCGIGPIRETLIGGIGSDGSKHAQWLATLRALGHDGK